MSEQWPDIMVDVETTGTSPDRNGIIQLGAVKFNLEDKTVNHDFFKQSVYIMPHRSWDQGTIEWWNKTNAELLREILRDGIPAKDAFSSFIDWVKKDTFSAKFWSKPSHFDYMFVDSHLKDCNLVSPFKYWDAKDSGSHLHGLHWPNKVPDLRHKLSDTGVAHDALNDCLSQIENLFNHHEEKTNGSK